MSRRSRRRRIRRVPVARLLLAGAGVLLGALLLLTASGAVVAYAAVTSWLKNLPDYRSPAAFELAEPTKIYSADGQLLAKFYLQNRDVVPISQIATSLSNGIVAVEDERFYQHGGVDPLGIVRALFTTASGDRQGASTITQQYVRNTILLDERTQITLERKVREAFLATEIEKILTKKQILENYLNTVYFGEGAYGADAAARTYFAKNAQDLTLPEAALLAGLVQSPSRLDPFTNPAGALARRQVVLARMLYNHYISKADYEQAVSAPLVLRQENLPLEGIYSAPYFVSYVRTLLQRQFSTGVVFNGGLTVYTSLDTHLQAIAEKTAHRDFHGRRAPSVALVSIDPNTGWVKAMVGGTDYAKSKFNLATQGHRQPGSSFKTFTLVTALSKGMSPTYEIDSHAPITIPSKPHRWTVNNDEGSGSGMMSLEAATWYSVNAVYARVAWYGIGIKNLVHTAEAMGITTPLSPKIASIALGSVGCTPLEMASAYGTLADSGVHHDPVVITKVLDRYGNTIYQATPHGAQVIKPSVAYAATKVLEGVISQGTATAANIGRPEAGKTGTSQSNRDCWFIGYTPQLVTSVWVGYTPERTIKFHGEKGFGGTVAAPIWARFMRAALAGQPARGFASAPSPGYDSSRFNLPVSYQTLHPPPPPKSAKPNAATTKKTTPTKTSKKKTKKKSSGTPKGGGSSGGGGSTETSPTP